MTASAPAEILDVLLVARELDLGGSERQLAETALWLDRALFRPHVACFRPGGIRARELKRAGVPVLELGVRSLVSRSAFSGARRLGRYLRRHRIQVVHAFDVPSVLFAVPVARLYSVPVVLSSQRAHRALTPGLTRHLLRLTDRLADGIVVNSQAVARELLAEDGVPRSLLHLAYNGIDTGRFRPEGFRAALPWSEPRLVIGVACALRSEKGLFTLLDAFARVQERCPQARLLIVGSGPMAGPLDERASHLRLGSACHFQPAVEEVAPWLRAMDIFVLPSLSEALSNSLMEAMACGCCGVASEVGGNPELIEHGRTGLLFPAGDSPALAAALESLIGSGALRHRLSEAGADFIRDGFSSQAAARRMGRIYAGCMGGSASDSVSMK
jgi:glycosyltransferase involved in cell wall biosynthesis